MNSVANRYCKVQIELPSMKSANTPHFPQLIINLLNIKNF